MSAPNEVERCIERQDYELMSNQICVRIGEILQDSLTRGDNRIIIRTNLKRGLPLENINKVAGPFVEAWAVEQFETVCDDKGNRYGLVAVKAGRRLDPFDVVLQFRIEDEEVSADVDAKATSEDIQTAGKSPNITSYARVRQAYLRNPDYIFIILSLKHRVYTEQVTDEGITQGVMEVTAFATFDLKFIAENDLNYNPALGTGQLQIRDIFRVKRVVRTTREFITLLDQKFLRSKSVAAWVKLAQPMKWEVIYSEGE